MNRNTNSQTQKYGLLYWIPMIWNGLTIVIFLIVGITFLIGSRQPSDGIVNLPGIILKIYSPSLTC